MTECAFVSLIYPSPRSKTRGVIQYELLYQCWKLFGEFHIEDSYSKTDYRTIIGVRLYMFGENNMQFFLSYMRNGGTQV